MCLDNDDWRIYEEVKFVQLQLSMMDESMKLDPNETKVEEFLTQIMNIDSTSKNEGGFALYDGE